MKIPKSLDIRGSKWKIDVRDEADRDSEVGHRGLCNDTNRTITIYSTGEPTEDLDTLMHEILHVAENQGVIINYEEQVAEGIIRGLSRFLAQVMIDNNLWKMK